MLYAWREFRRCSCHRAGVTVYSISPVLELDIQQTDLEVITFQCPVREASRYSHGTCCAFASISPGPGVKSYIIVYHRIPRHACMHAPGESLPVSSCAVRDRRLLVSSEAVARALMARQARVSSRLQHSPPRRQGFPLTGFL